MKLAGMAGTGSGKLGSQVYTSVAGQQVVRNYNANIANPSTEAQVAQRSRMKLMSQISAAMASVIVMPKKGMMSPRNVFAKRNFARVMSADTEAIAFLENFKLTTGSSAIPRVRMQRTAGNRLKISLASSAEGIANRVVYNLFARSEEGDLMLLKSVVQNTAGNDGFFETTVDDYESDLYVYAYGMKDKNEQATAKYSDYKVQSGEDIAKLYVQRSLKSSDYQFTDTAGNSMTAEDTETVEVPEGSVLVRYYIKGDGAIRNNSVSGAVVSTPLVKPRGTRFKWYAVAAPGYAFKQWQFNDDISLTQKANPAIFTAWVDTDVAVIFYGEPVVITGGME